MLRLIVPVMPQVAYWHCNPQLTGDAWFTLVKPEKVEFEVSADLMHHQRRIIGSWVTSLFHMEKCAHDLTDWKLWPRNAITHRFSLEQAGDAYALMASGKCGKVVINFPD